LKKRWGKKLANAYCRENTVFDVSLKAVDFFASLK
jgi:hypothetical protein